MRLMKRNTVSVYYCLYQGKQPLLDADGYETGESSVSYATPVQMTASISPATGSSQIEMFGNLESYDKIMITDNLNCPITENSGLFVEKLPSFDSDGNPVFDYVVKRISKSMNHISYAISKVKIS